MAPTTGVLQWTDTGSLRKDRPGQGVAHYVQKWWESMELCLGMGNEPAGTLWVSISAQTNMGSSVVGVHYRMSNQEEVEYEAFFRHLEEASCLQAVVFMGDFNHPHNCWKSSTAQAIQEVSGAPW